MKKLILILLLFPILLACKKQEFEGERPDERLTEALEAYNTQLSEAQYGWKAHLYPNGGGGFGFYLEFNGKNRVTMMGDVLEESGNESMESSYRLKATLLPSLYFDTYSYIHLLSDPDPNVYGGQPGWGLYSDFEFSFTKVTNDTIRLRGNLSGSELVLIRASQGEREAYKAGNLNVMRQQVTDFFENKKFNYLETLKGTLFSSSLNLNDKTLSLSFDSAGTIATRKMGFAFSGLNELVLSAPFHYEGLNFDKIFIEEGGSRLIIPNGGRELEFLSNDQPVFPLDKLIGVAYQAIAVPMEEEVMGSGSDFNARRNAFLTAGRASLAAGTTFPQMKLVLNKADQTMTIEQIIRQESSNFAAYFIFGYKKVGEEYQFKYEGPMDGNAEFLEQAFRPIIEGLVSGNIVLNYELTGNTLRASGMRSGFPAFKFIGDLQ